MSHNVTHTPLSQSVASEGDSNLLMAVIGILSFFSVVGTVGNLMVLYVYARKRNKLASTIFIITLACTDFFTCIIIIPYTMTVEYVSYNLRYDFACKLYMFFITSNVPFSAFIMVAIAVDRYLCICHPFLHILNARRAKMTIIWLAFIAFVLGMITSLNFGVFQMQSTKYADNSTLAEALYSLMNYNASLTYAILSNLTIAQNISLDDLVVPQENEQSIVHSGICRPNGLLFSTSFTDTYQKVYSSFFVIVFIAVVILYVLIYKFVTVRRARRQRQRSQRSGYSSYRGTENSFLQTRASISNGCVQTEVDTEFNVARNKSERSEIFSRQLTIREKGIVANIRTAGMLFVVTVVFIIVFLPAWLMAHRMIPYNMLIFYMYFFYNVANPMVYAFMNKAFRRDLRDLLVCKSFQPL